MKTSFLLVTTTLIFLTGCKKESTSGSNEKYSFTGTIDNSPVRWEVKATDNPGDTSKYQARPHYMYSQWPIDCATADCYYVAAGIVVQERNRGNAIQVIFIKSAKTSDLNQLKPFLVTGSKSYGSQRTSAYTSTNNGILIRYTENGRIWNSEIGDQTGSSFESIEFKEATTNKNLYSHVWKARFSCKVYFSGLPPKTLENCEIYGPAFYK